MKRSALFLSLITILPCASASSSKTHDPDTLFRNNESFAYFDNGKERDCKWIGFKQSRRERLCKEVIVYDNCPQSCGHHCWNDPKFQFEKKNRKGNASCRWVDRNQARKDRYCDKSVSPIDSSSGFQGKVMVRYACPRACDFCDTYQPHIKPDIYM